MKRGLCWLLQNQVCPPHGRESSAQNFVQVDLGNNVAVCRGGDLTHKLNKSSKMVSVFKAKKNSFKVKTAL